ncbi:hypothetical protein V7122_19425, partial [Bacillus sp. JJ1532]
MDVIIYFIKEIGLYNSSYLLITLLGVIVSALGIIVTGIFSFLLWKATKLTNELTKANYELASTVTKYQIEKENGVKSRYRSQVWKKVNFIVFTLRKQIEEGLDYKDVIETYSYCKEIGLSDEIIGMYFDQEEKFIIDSTWALFNDYVETWWKEDGEIRKSNSITNIKLHNEMAEHAMLTANSLYKLLLKN